MAFKRSPVRSRLSPPKALKHCFGAFLFFVFVYNGNITIQGDDMKKIFLSLFAVFFILLFSACDTQQDLIDEMEQQKAEYAKYDQYADLIHALEEKDYTLAEKLLEGYEAGAYNEQLNAGTLQEIIINNDNWSEYFEVKKITEWTENDLGETTGFITHLLVVVSDNYADRVILDNFDLVFEWSALCSVKNCTVDLANCIVSYENVFKSTSTTFGEPERLSGTLTSDSDTFSQNNWAKYHGVAEIGEIVIVGEYLLGTEMKPVCFDYDEVSITRAEGILTLRDFGG